MYGNGRKIRRMYVIYAWNNWFCCWVSRVFCFYYYGNVMKSSSKIKHSVIMNYVFAVHIHKKALWITRRREERRNVITLIQRVKLCLWGKKTNKQRLTYALFFFQFFHYCNSKMMSNHLNCRQNILNDACNKDENKRTRVLLNKK